MSAKKKVKAGRKSTAKARGKTLKTAASSLVVSLPLTSAYAGEGVGLKKQNVKVELDLRGGKQGCESAVIKVGEHQGMAIHARVNFSYEYNRKENRFIMRGNGDKSADQLRITTFLGGKDKLSSCHTPNDIGLNLRAGNMWTQKVLNSPGLQKVLADSARDCNKALVEAVMDAGVERVLELGAAPVVTLENLDNFRRMFGEPVTKLSKSTAPEEIAKMQDTLDSLYQGTEWWRKGKNFANVEETTRDPIHGYGSWLKLWRDHCNGGRDPTDCTSKNCFSGRTDFEECNATLVGGHVIPGTQSGTMPPDSDVYIFPICSVHNGKRDLEYMTVQKRQEGVLLRYWA